MYEPTKTILLVCFTNHALDQFLEDIMDMGIPAGDIVRLGGKATPKTEGLSMRAQDKPRVLDYSALDAAKLDANSAAHSIANSFKDYHNTIIKTEDIMIHIEFQDPDYFDAFQFTATADDGMLLVGKQGRTIDEYYLLDQWLNGLDAGVLKDRYETSQHAVWLMEPSGRTAKFEEWKKEILQSKVEDLCDAIKSYNVSRQKVERVFAQTNIAVLQGKRIIACTTTGAAMNAESLRAASPNILLVEEAGEVLESHILTALVEEMSQLILIGDHKYVLSTFCAFYVINNGLDSCAPRSTTTSSRLTKEQDTTLTCHSSNVWL